ncbi:MAG: hypothetical protein IPQ07_25170 [Myxococcales bacterium]|nr:hypothetical protein [Myxococcales bacterium]
MTESVQLATDAFGPDDVETGRQLALRAAHHGGNGDCTAALADVETARKALTPLPAAAPERFHLGRASALCLMRANDHDGAMRELRSMETALVSTGRSSSLERAIVLGDQADAERGTGHAAIAADLYIKSAEVFDAVVGSNDRRGQAMRAKARSLAVPPVR